MSLDDMEAYRAALKLYRGKRVLLSIQPPRREKTYDQLGYYHSTVLPEFARGQGESDLRLVHWDLKDAFLEKKEHVKPITGEITYIVPSLADVTVEQMSEFLDAVIQYAHTNGWPIPPPRS